MSLVFTVLEVSLAIWAVVTVIRNHQRARAAFPEVSADAPAVSGWHWSEPPPGLDTHHGPESSAVALPLRCTAPLSSLLVLAGYATLLFSAVALVQGLRIHDNIWIPLTAAPVFAAMGWGLLHADARLARVTLSAEQATLDVRYGIWLRRQLTIRRKRAAKMKISGGTISSFEMVADQEHPEYRLRAGRHKVLADCDQTQGSWLVAGLTQWARS